MMMMAMTMLMRMKCLPLFAVVIVLLANDAIGFDCVNVYKPGQVVSLQQNCAVAVFCHHRGYMTTESVTTSPLNTKCVSNKYQCVEGMVPATRDYSGFVASCKYPLQCLHQGKTYNNKNFWLRSDCLAKYTCEEGTVKELGSHQCPPNSVCYDGQCKCLGDTVPSFGDHFIVRRCKSADAPEEPEIPEPEGACKDGAKAYKLNEEWLESDCSKRYRCTSNGIELVGPHSCKDFTKCDHAHGECKCIKGYTEHVKSSKGLLEACRPECKDAVNEYKLHEYWLRGDCKLQFKCSYDGIRRGIIHGCPWNSSCDNSNHYGQCLCNPGYVSTGTDNKGFLTGCKPQ